MYMFEYIIIKNIYVYNCKWVVGKNDEVVNIVLVMNKKVTYGFKFTYVCNINELVTNEKLLAKVLNEMFIGGRDDVENCRRGLG